MLRKLPPIWLAVSTACCTALFATTPAFAEETAHPNVLMIVSDDLQACLSCYGNSVCQTPNLDRLAARGVLFERAYCQYPVCGPSRASFMSGLYPNSTGLLGNNANVGSFPVANPRLADHPSLGRFLKEHGYVSLRVSKIYHMGVPGGIEAGDPGGDEPMSWDRAFNVMAPETASPGELVLLSPKRKHFGSNFAAIAVPDDEDDTQADRLTTRQAAAILENRARGRGDSRFIRPDQPFFLAVGFVRPHVPLIAPQRLFDRYPAEDSNLPEVPENDLLDTPEAARGMENFGRYGMSEIQQKQALAAYYASVTYMDEQVGELLNTLERLKIADDTIVIFTSDHGYNLGEHGLWQKLSLFEDTLRVPLIISDPRQPETAGHRTQAIAQLIDLYPTIGELTGLQNELPPILQGHSLASTMRHPDTAGPNEQAYTVTYRNGQSLRTDRYRYNRWGTVNDSGNNEELYDLQSDPGEFKNLISSADHNSIREELRQRLDAVREASLSMAPEKKARRK